VEVGLRRGVVPRRGSIADQAAQRRICRRERPFVAVLALLAAGHVEGSVAGEQPDEVAPAVGARRRVPEHRHRSLAFQHYRNLRGERLAIETPDEGHRCRVSIDRAFAAGADPAAVCVRLCRLAADTPLIGVEFDAEREDLRMVAEMPVEDGAVTRLQLLSLVDRLVEAAEVWHFALAPAALGGADERAIA